eukprot:TRINITY_DN14927_c0_g3_i1.p1 TRINITY_DN14927_c0_g3~~TRINITY_DN14927_c0_g3_i1.p1  ORF type:complete len:1155 (+),score=362.40 TRINITY_DN14927_c0_g3_i1:181-3645(+)
MCIRDRYKVFDKAEIADILSSRDSATARYVFGGTMAGVYAPDLESSTFIDISAIPELAQLSLDDHTLRVGAATSIADLSSLLAQHSSKSQSFEALHQHMNKIASFNVRNAGSWAGNLVMARNKNFASDMATILMGAGAHLSVLIDGNTADMSVEDWLWLPDLPANALILSLSLPVAGPDEFLFTFRQALRYVNAHALLNASFRATLDGSTIKSVSLAVGCAKEHAFFLDETQTFLIGKSVTDPATLSEALALLSKVQLEPELQYHSTIQPQGKDAYRASLLQVFFFKFLLKLAAQSGADIPATISEAAPAGPDAHQLPTVSGTQTWAPQQGLPEGHPGTKPATKPDAQQIAAGEAKYTDDVHNAPGTLFGAFACSKRAAATLTKADSSAAAAMPGVTMVIDAAALAGAGVPPESFCYSMVPGETPMFVAVGTSTLFQGQPVALVLAESRAEAEAAARVLEGGLEFEAAEHAGIFSMDEAKSANPERTGGIGFDPTPAKQGDVEAVWGDCATLVEGTCVIGGNNHFPMEKQSAYVIPGEGGEYTVYAATQMPDAVHTVVCIVLGVPKNKVSMIMKRAGGGFGAKLTGSFPTAMAAALASKFTGAPVKVQNTIGVDMQMGGNCRHPVSMDYKIGCDADGKIIAYSCDSHLDGGCGNDFSGFVAGEVRDNIEGPYCIPNLLSKVTVYKTNTASNTAVRGPGLAQAAACTEMAIDALAAKHGMDSSEMRFKNLMTPEESICITGGKLADNTVPQITEQLVEKAQFHERKQAVAAFNAEHKWKKRGIEYQPIRYNHTHAFGAGTTVQVNVNGSDGSVVVWHTGTEIGQGLNAKLVSAVSMYLGIPGSSVQVKEVNTSVLPNAMITGGSVMSECVVKAAGNACDILLERLAPVRQFMSDTDGTTLAANPMMSGGQFGALQATGPAGQEPTWEQLCCFSSGSFMPFDLHINLAAVGHYVNETRNNLDFVKAPLTPGATTCGFKVGHGLADYFSAGAGISEVEIDCLTGAKTIIRSDIIQDTGNSLNAQIDIGQSEGAFVQGLGYFLQEEVFIGADGTNNSPDTWEYKPCLAGDIPRTFNVELANLGAPKNELGLPYVAGSKAVGEPPYLMAVSALSAIRSAIRASRVERGLSAEFTLQQPATVDRIQQALEIDAAKELRLA